MISNYSNSSLVSGTYYADSIYNSGKYVTVSAGRGNDTIDNASWGNYSSLNGGYGNDSINAGSGSYRVTLKGGYGNDTLTGSTSTYYGDVFQFGNYDDFDVITNYASNDTIHFTSVYSLNNIVHGASGNDYIFNLSSEGKVTVKGAAYIPIKVRLADGSMVTLDGYPDDGDSTQSGGLTNNTSYITFSGSSGADLMTNNADRVTLKALQGNDNITNNGNYASLVAAAGNDRVVNKGNNTTISAGAGDDTIINSGNYVSMMGGKGNDYFNTYSTTYGVTMRGGAGNDTLTGSNSGDVFQFGNADGQDVITNYGTNDTIYLSGRSSNLTRNSEYSYSAYGDDLYINLSYGNSITVKGGKSKAVTVKLSNGYLQTLTYTTGSTIPTQSGGDDINYVTNSGSSKLVEGGVFTDDYISNSGNYVTVSAGSGNDTISNSGDYASINGGIGNDSINAGSYSYRVTLKGNSGNDTLTGSTSYGDVFQFTKTDGNDVITNYGTNDTVHLTDTWTASDINYSTSGSDGIINTGSTYITLKGAAQKSITVRYGYLTTVVGGGPIPTPTLTPDPTPTRNTISNYYDDTLVSGTSGADSIYNGGEYVTISAGAGNDTIINGTTGDYSSISGGAGNDSINAGLTYRVTINGGTGNDTLTGSTTTYSGDIFQFGNYDGFDVVTNYGTNDTIHLTQEDYSFDSYTSGNDFVIELSSSGKVTLKGAASKPIQVLWADGNLNTFNNDYYYDYAERDLQSTSTPRNYTETPTDSWFTQDDNFITNDINSIIDTKSEISTDTFTNYKTIYNNFAEDNQITKLAYSKDNKK